MSEREYSIRAHHIEWFAELLTSAKAPDAFARQKLHEIEKASTDMPLPLPHSYVQDVLGDTVEDHPGYAQRLASVFATFLALPDSSKVIIGPDKDEICAACAHGLHCDTKPDATSQASVADAYNAIWVMALLRNTVYTMLREDSDDIVIETTAGDLRNALRNFFEESR